MVNVTKSKEMGNFKLFVEKKFREIQIGRARRRCEGDIKMEHKEVNCKILCVGWIVYGSKYAQ